MGEAFGDELPPRRGATSSRPRSLPRSLAALPSTAAGTDYSPGTRDTQLHRAPKVASRVSRQVDAWPKHLTWPEKSGDREEKVLRAASREPRSPRPQSSHQRAARGRGPPAARGSGHLTGRLCALTSGRAEATPGHLLGTRFGACRSSRCSLGFSNKFQGGRRRQKKKKKKKRSNYANRLRTGRRALDLTRLLYEFSEQPRAGQIYAGASRLRQVQPPEHLEVN